jgi:hypothetical protein
MHQPHREYDRLVQGLFLLASESQAFVSRVVRCRPAPVVGEISEAFVGRPESLVGTGRECSGGNQRDKGCLGCRQCDAVLSDVHLLCSCPSETPG